MHTILIIEDEDPLRLTLADRLTIEGFRVQTAADGQEGIRQALAAPPDLILCDVMMPVLDGYGVLKTLQADARTAAIPFLFLTAKAGAQQVRAGMDLGADDYLCKPVAKADLLAAIRARLEKHHRQEHRLEQAAAVARVELVRKLPHEMLTPLTGLLSTGQLLETADPKRPIAEVCELGRSIRLASQRLHRTIRRFLLYAELAMASQDEKAQAQLRGAYRIPTSALTTDLAEHLARQDSRPADLQLDLHEMELTISPPHFGELLLELVDNAFKFSAPGSVVRVQLSLQPDESCLLIVSDHGRGMTANQIRQVGAFRQFDADLWTQSGTGLGLAIVKQLTALYHGSFKLESTRDDGTRATLQLPNIRRDARGAASWMDPSFRKKVAWELGVG